MKGEYDLDDSKLKLELKNRLGQYKGKEELHKRSKTDHADLVKTISITSYLMVALAYFLFLEVGVFKQI